MSTKGPSRKTLQVMTNRAATILLGSAVSVSPSNGHTSLNTCTCTASNEDTAWAGHRKGLALFGMGRHAEALAAVQEGLQQSPNSADLQQAQSLIGSALHRPAQSAIAAAAPDQPAQLREAGSQTALEAALATLRTAGESKDESA